MRAEDPETGAARTIVMDADGKQRIFGENTVESLASRNEADVEQWFAAMTLLQLRGLVHEVSIRVVGSSTKYFDAKREVEQRSENRNYAFFGLTAGSTERELDNAYRRLAREMHPDKNGGTDEAKERFQRMKHRYEKLKNRSDEQQASASGPARAGGPAPAGPQAPTETEEPSDKKPEALEPPPPRDRKKAMEAYDEDEEEEAEVLGGEQVADIIDPLNADRPDLERSAWKMLRQLKAIKSNMRIIEAELEEIEKDDLIFRKN